MAMEKLNSDVTNTHSYTRITGTPLSINGG